MASEIRAGSSELIPMLRLAAPLVLAELGWMAMGIEDTMYVGRVSAEALGAVALGTVIFYSIAVAASGLMLGMDTVISRAFGANDLKDCQRWLVDGIWLALGLTPIVMGAVWLCMPLLSAFGDNPAVLAQVRPYVGVLVWSAPPLMVYFALRRYLQAIDLAHPVMMTLIAANLANLAGNWVLVFGHFGFPPMGARGAAYATLLSRLVMMGALTAVIWRHDAAHGIGLRDMPWKPERNRIAALLRLGGPAAGQIGLETAVFATATVIIGKLSAATLAGHQIALNVVSTTYMMPLGVSSAAAVRVGQAIGRERPRDAARSGWTAIGVGASLMSCAAIALLVFSREIARLFTPDPAIVEAGASLLRIAAFFQLFDGLQVVVTGALRGAGDTRTPMICHFVGYWVVGLPLGWVLCFHWGLGAAGLWMGLSAGLILIGSVLLGWWRRAARQM